MQRLRIRGRYTDPHEEESRVQHVNPDFFGSMIELRCSQYSDYNRAILTLMGDDEPARTWTRAQMDGLSWRQVQDAIIKHHRYDDESEQRWEFQMRRKHKSAVIFNVRFWVDPLVDDNVVADDPGLMQLLVDQWDIEADGRRTNNRHSASVMAMNAKLRDELWVVYKRLTKAQDKLREKDEEITDLKVQMIEEQKGWVALVEKVIEKVTPDHVSGILSVLEEKLMGAPDGQK